MYSTLIFLYTSWNVEAFWITPVFWHSDFYYLRPYTTIIAEIWIQNTCKWFTSFYFLSKIKRFVHYAKQNQEKNTSLRKKPKLSQLLCKIIQKMHYFISIFLQWMQWFQNRLHTTEFVLERRNHNKKTLIQIRAVASAAT